MGRKNEKPSKTIGFKLVVDESDCKRGRNVSQLDKEVYDILCNVPIYMSITEFIKKAIVNYGNLTQDRPGSGLSDSGINRIIKDCKTVDLSILENKLDKIEDLLRTSQISGKEVPRQDKKGPDSGKNKKPNKNEEQTKKPGNMPDKSAQDPDRETERNTGERQVFRPGPPVSENPDRKVDDHSSTHEESSPPIEEESKELTPSEAEVSDFLQDFL